MFGLENIDFTELDYWEELENVGIKNANDLIKPAIAELLNTGIHEHIRKCNLSKNSCIELLKYFEDKGLDLQLTQDSYPNILSLPTSFVDAESEDDIEHQKALNYASWVVSKVLTEKKLSNIDNSGIVRAYPFNVLCAIFGVHYDCGINSFSLRTSISQTLDKLLNDLHFDEFEVLNLIYKHGLSSDDIVHEVGVQNHTVAKWAIEEIFERTVNKALRKLRHPSRSKHLKDFLLYISYLENVEGSVVDDIKNAFLCEENLTWTAKNGEREIIRWHYDGTGFISKLFRTTDFPINLIYYADRFAWCTFPVGLLKGTELPIIPREVRNVAEKAYFSTNTHYAHYLLILGRDTADDDYWKLFEANKGELRRVQVDTKILRNLHRIIEENVHEPKVNDLYTLYTAEKQLCDIIAKQTSDIKEKVFYQMFLEVVNEKISKLPYRKLENIEEITIEELNFSVRTFNCLKRANINTLGDIVSKTENEMKEIRNFNGVTLNEVISKMNEYGLELSSD